MNAKDLKFFTEEPCYAKSKIRALEHSGVIFIDSRSAYIGEDAEVGPGTIIYPGVFLLGNTKVGKDCKLEEDVKLEDADVGDSSKIRTGSRISESRIGKKCTIWGARMYNADIKNRVTVHSGSRIVWSIIGAGCEIDSDCHIKYAYIASSCEVGPKAIIEGEKFDEEILVQGKRSVRIGRSCRIGAQTHIHDWARIETGAELAHCEIVRSTIGAGTKVKHCSYIGDVRMGCGCNVGAGTVFGNYDGKNKNQCEVGDGVFMGINNSVVSSSVGKIGEGSYTGAHTLLTEAVEPDTVVIRASGPQKILRRKPSARSE